MADAREHGCGVSFRVPEVQNDFTEFVQVGIVAVRNAVSEFGGRLKRPPLNAVVCSFVPIVDIERGKLSQARSNRGVIGERAEVHFNLSTKRKVATGLSTVGEQVVEPSDVSRLREQPDGFRLRDHAVADVQCIFRIQRPRCPPKDPLWLADKTTCSIWHSMARSNQIPPRKAE